ncbi:MAG: NAD-dependent epimerase/dehydratase family protein [Deltaproteobacteria bacterium]|nr:NAD-dependent epimerase/dehydratase family protein [Deltaproteobacteria bacterium]
MTKKGTKYFVTGGAGFIGSHLVDRLVERGGVTVYDNLSSGWREFLEHHLGRGDFNFIEADLLDFDTLKGAIGGHDVVFHLAANPDVRAGIAATDLDLRAGTMASYNVLEAMRRNGVKQVVFASSSTVYGDAGITPVGEDYGPLRPISLYGASKLGSEGLISAFCHLFGMQGWIFRLANIIGPRLTHGVIFNFINRLKENPGQLEILGDGRQQKPYLHVDDCLDGMLLAVEKSGEPLNVFNLGPASSTSVVRIAEVIVAAMGLKGVAFSYAGGDRGWAGDVPQVRFDVSSMNRLGWKPKYSSDQAVERTVRELLSGGASNE